MNTNVGNIDRVLRAAIGIALIALALTDRIGAWGWIGIVPLATAMVGYCPAYSLFGIGTCRTPHRSKGR